MDVASCFTEAARMRGFECSYITWANRPKTLAGREVKADLYRFAIGKDPRRPK